MILYGRATLYPSESDPALGPRAVGLWRTNDADSYLRLANADTDCPPDPTGLNLDDGQTEPYRYEFFQVNRAPQRELGAPERAWLIKGRAQTSYLVSAKTNTNHWVEFRPYLYIGRSSNPSQNNFIDGDSSNPNDGSNYPINPPDYTPVQGGDFVPSERSFIAYYYAAALVQEYGADGYRAGVACVVGVSSLDTPVTVSWHYVLFQNRTCLAAVAAPELNSWSAAPWIRMNWTTNTVQVLANGDLVITHSAVPGNWSRYTLRLMETLFPNTTNGSILGEWVYYGNQMWTAYVPIGRVAGVRSAYTSHPVEVPLTEATPLRVRVRSSSDASKVIEPSQFRSDSGPSDPEPVADGFYQPKENPLGTNWRVFYPITSPWTAPMLLEYTELEESAASPFVIAEWVSASSGVMGSTAQTRYRAGNSNAPLQIYLRRGSTETLLETVPAPSGGWDGTTWYSFNWVRTPPRGAFELVYRLTDAPDAVLSGTVTAQPTIQLQWVSPSARAVGQTFTVQITASGSDQNVTLRTIHGGIETERGVFSPPARGYWLNDSWTVSWTATAPYGAFTVRATLEDAQAELTGTVLTPTLEAQWVSPPNALAGQTMEVRARVSNTDAPLQFYLRRGSTETLIANYNAPTGGWNGEWRHASWVATPPPGSVEWRIVCGEEQVSLWGNVVEPFVPEDHYGHWKPLKIALPHTYWIIRSPQTAVSARVLPRTLIQLGAGWGLLNTDQGRLLEIETYFDT